MNIDPVIVGFVSIPVLITLIAMEVPIGLALGAVGIAGMTIIQGFDVAVSQLTFLPYNQASQFPWAVIPLFIMMGYICGVAGISDELYDTTRKWLGRLPGGAAIATVGACGLFGACSGSSLAAVTLFGRVSLPPMLRLGYSKTLASGCIAAGGAFAILIPPSIMMVIYALIADISVGHLLIAGIFPGIVSVIVYAITIIIWVRIRPQDAPAYIESISWRERFVSLGVIWQPAFLIALVIGGIYAGVFTPTEAGAAGAFGALLIAIAKRRLTINSLARGLLDSARTTAAIFFIIIFGIYYSRFLAMSGVIPNIVDFFIGLDLGVVPLVMSFMLIYIILGTFLDATSMIVLTVPIMVPILNAYGYPELVFAILVIKMIELGVITPPLGLNVYALKASAGDYIDNVWTIFRGCVWFMLAELVMVGIIMAFHQLVLYLPNLMMK